MTFIHKKTFIYKKHSFIKKTFIQRGRIVGLLGRVSATSGFSPTLFLSLKVWNFEAVDVVRDIYTNNVAKIGIRHGKMESTDIKEEEGYSTMFFIAQLGGQAVCEKERERERE